ncbi:hypothetical protein J5U23_02898 [Saccharolobus shibatae B12]|uniref:Uncharacterized protein n=1 Tax=Saccharolobus shibatae (strain ATCC 51178 / DSM 5389 / JCM 8931 / NBRC 15437 / B12) TaxID=523848 RepID=A0A8F5BRI7_SACSH|nr:hypothetical protein [Saccharolobus shibatae]QXJ27116.1 hypothetical protein J5U23_p2898 [Saccharolobus shibatae B12]QXJ30009.1 hypothetical protein J5U23_02898 [Saccharolobus shibatae B12]
MMGLEGAANYLVSLLMQLFNIVYNVGEELFGGLPQTYLTVFAFLVTATLPSALMYVFVAYRKYILYLLLFGWFLFILAVILF